MTCVSRRLITVPRRYLSAPAERASSETAVSSSPLYNWRRASSLLSPFIGGAYPRRVNVVDVAPRDGLQNERADIPTAVKVELIHRIVDSGVTHVECAAFVSPTAVPAMSDGEAVMKNIHRRDGVTYSALTPNVRGLERAVQAQCQTVAVFASASESFSRRNIRCSIAESLERFAPVIARATALRMPVRGYVSCVVGCPYEGPVDPAAVRAVALELYRLGCYQVSLGDTIGIGSVGAVSAMIHAVTRDLDVNRFAVHFHDTYGQAIANVHAALTMGIDTVDSSVGGLGGCPYAAGATGNVATEDVVLLLNQLGIDSGIQLSSLVETAEWIHKQIGKIHITSRTANALRRFSV